MTSEQLNDLPEVDNTTQPLAVAARLTEHCPGRPTHIWPDGASQLEKLARTFGYAGDFHRAFDTLLLKQSRHEPISEGEQNILRWLKLICRSEWSPHRQACEAERSAAIVELQAQYRSARAIGDSESQERAARSLRHHAEQTTWAAPGADDSILQKASAARRALLPRQSRLDFVRNMLAMPFKADSQQIIDTCQSTLPPDHPAYPHALKGGGWTKYEVKREGWITLQLELRAELPKVERDVADLTAAYERAKFAADEHTKKILSVYVPE
jgi:hypothetical protein